MLSWTRHMRLNSALTLSWAAIALLAAADTASAGETRWIRLRTANFDLYTSASPRSARDTLREFEQVRSFFLQVFGGPPAKPIPVRLVSFGSAKEFEPYRLNEFAVAYYHQTLDRDYIVMSHGASDIFPVAVHEYVHLLVRHSELKLPPWLNEGLAELYSTLRPIADKILVGDLVPGRREALLQEKWVPLAVILAADEHSPYYNEKNKAGNLYNEGWALTHMLYFRAEYRPKVGQLIRTISSGTGSAEALQQVYGRTVPQIERDLQGYLRGNSFQGAIVSAKLEKAEGEIAAEPVSDFDTDLMLTDLMYRPGKEAVQQAAFERLLARDPKRPEPYRGLGYLAWHSGQPEKATEYFGKAFERGDREPRLMWDYGRLLEHDQGETAISVLRELLAQDDSRMDARLELAEAQVRANHPVAALATLAPIHIVAPADSARFFRIAVYAHLRNGDRKAAEETARHFRDLAKTDADRETADLLVSQTAMHPAAVETARVETVDPGRPSVRRNDKAAVAPVLAPAPVRERPSASGRFVELDCRGQQARMILETATGRKAFLIEDPRTVAITAGADGPVDMNCGVQKTPVKVEVGYDAPRPNQTGVEGVVRTLAF